MPTRKGKGTAAPNRPPCDPRAVAAFDSSGLHPDFLRLSRPAQRALVNHRILDPSALSGHSLREVLAFHGIGPSSIPILRQALRNSGLRFRH